MNNPTLAQLSNLLVYSSLLVLSCAFVAFAADLAFGTGRVRAASVPTNHRSRQVTGNASVLVEEPQNRPASADQRCARVGISLTFLGWLLLAGAVAARGVSAGRPPWGNMYEFSLAGALAVLTVWLFLVLRGSDVRFLGLPITLAVLLTLGVAVVVLYTEAAQLVPALKSYWLWIHVTAAILSSGIFTVGASATVLYLLTERRERRQLEGVHGGRLGFLDGFAARLPSSSVLDRAAYRSFAFAFPLWFFAIVAGAIWAAGAWGRYWGWDPKETWSFITLVIFAAYLHARATPGWRGRPAAVIALFGYAAFLFNYFGVNIWFFGLHSYGGA